MLPSRSSRFRLAPRIIAVFAVAYAFLWITRFPRHYDDDELPEELRRSKSGHPYQVHHDQLVVTIRTTATEAFAKIPILLLLTNTIYHEQTNVMSDLQMDIGAFHIHDVLDRYNVKFVAAAPDMERYRQLLHYAQDGKDIQLVKEADPRRERDVIAMLDKYKYLRMIERAWELKPDRKWYVFVDTQTYLIRANLMDWLGSYDPNSDHFFAHPPSHTPDGLGGDTFILSANVMKRIVKEHKYLVPNWDEIVPEYTTGFEVLTAALDEELDLKYDRSWPGISDFQPETAPFGPGIWCEPVIAMHNIPPELASEVWRLQRDREDYNHIHDALTFADLYGAFIQQVNLNEPKDDWDNLSSAPDNARWNVIFEGVEIEHPSPEHLAEHEHMAEHVHKHHPRDDQGRAPSGEESFEACQESCNSSPHCVQFSFSSIPRPNHNENGETKCHLSQSFRLGTYKEPIEIDVGQGKTQLSWKSGWRKDKFEKWTRMQRCKGQQNKN